MTGRLFHTLQDTYGFEPVNESKSLKEVENSDPIDGYNLGSGRLNFYENDPSWIDKIHPFRSSGDVIAELVSDNGETPEQMYLSGTYDDLEEVQEVLSEPSIEFL